MRTWFGHGWAQPVVSRRWAFVASMLGIVKRTTNYRWSWPTIAAHRAFERATGFASE